jgi:hypothetical protein
VTAQADTPSRAASFFDEVRETWQAAADGTRMEERAYRIAGLGLELRFAGAALVPALTRALAHLPAPPPDVPTLVVHAWDTRTTGVAIPPAPWGADDYLEYGKIRGFFGERFQCAFQWGSHSLVMLDVERGEAIYWVESAEQIPHFEMAAPLRIVLHGWLAARDVELVHAAAVGSDDGCVLLAGKSGAGKTWTALAASCSGLRLLADDYCLLRAGSPTRVASVYNAAKTHADALGRLPFLDPMVDNPERPDGDKAVYFLREHDPIELLLEADLRAVLVPRRITTGTARLVPAPAAAALAALAPSTILQLPAAGAETLRRLTSVVRDVPSFYLDVGAELAAIGPTIASALA